MTTTVTGRRSCVAGSARHVALRRVGQALGVSQAAAGALLIGDAARVASAVSTSRQSMPPLWVVRLLGVRLLVQGTTGAVWPGPELSGAGAAVDATHAASMMLAAAVVPRYRRPALISAAVAFTSSGLSAGIAAFARRSIATPAGERTSHVFHSARRSAGPKPAARGRRVACGSSGRPQVGESDRPPRRWRTP
jgi:type IV secretory pathway TrbL component